MKRTLKCNADPGHHLRTCDRSMRVWRGVALAAIAFGFITSSQHPGEAQSDGPSVPDQIAALRQQVARLEAALGQEREVRASRDEQVQSQAKAYVDGLVTAEKNARVAADASAAAQLTAHGQVLQWFSVTPRDGGADLRISGANLQIVNGTGQTDQVNGFGNLVVGYNELRNNPDSADVRTGSHNIVTGTQNNYASFGGLLGGLYSSITAPFASVTGGLGGTASGFCASVTGGRDNRATGESASVTGGYANLADGWNCSVVGGQSNRASGSVCSVTAGYLNVADGGGASVTGGQSNRAGGGPSSVSGGFGRSALDWGTWRAGSLSSAP
jgi:hypothetical protein